MSRPSVLFVTAECAPLAKVGGLGDVAGALPKALLREGLDVRVVMPRYGFIDTTQMKRHDAPLGVPMSGGEAWCAIYETRIPESDVPLYLIEHDALYGGDAVYAGFDGDLFGLARAGLLCRGALQLCHHLDWIPDVFHVHDWPSAVLPIMLDTVERGGRFDESATVLSIHNLSHQPRFPAAGIELLQVGRGVYRPDGIEDFGELNPLKGGLYHATMLSTVSAGYATEIQTPEGGAGLHQVTQPRSNDLIGIVNGIDTDVWDPANDPHIAAPYSADDLTGKARCKAALQAEMGLAVDSERPLLGVVSRWAPQKGIDIIAEALDRLLEMDVQLVMLGSGDPGLEAYLRARSDGDRDAGDDRFRVGIGFNEPLAHRIEAGADLFLMPSRFEPCGLNQLYSQRYGTLPVVRATGGLNDTVEQCDPEAGTGTGFKFDHLSSDALVGVVEWAVSIYRDRPEVFGAMRDRAMRKSLGWTQAARAYERLYEIAVERVRA